MTNEDLLVATALAAWKTNLARFESGLASMSDDKLLTEVAPGRNRIKYLVGHLAVVHDRMFPQLGLAERLHPELDEEFLAQPDRAVQPETSVEDLRKAWHEIHNKLTPMLEALTPAQWLEKHALVSVDDFGKRASPQPLRSLPQPLKPPLLPRRTNQTGQVKAGSRKQEAGSRK